MQRIALFRRYNDGAEEAASFYVSIFANARILTVARCGETGPGPAGSVMTVHFELDDQEFIALHGGPHFECTEAISLSVSCDTQEEVDTNWESSPPAARRTATACAGRSIRACWVRCLPTPIPIPRQPAGSWW